MANELPLWKVTTRFPSHRGIPEHDAVLWFAAETRDAAIKQLGALYPHGEIVAFVRMGFVKLPSAPPREKEE